MVDPVGWPRRSACSFCCWVSLSSSPALVECSWQFLAVIKSSEEMARAGSNLAFSLKHGRGKGTWIFTTFPPVITRSWLLYGRWDVRGHSSLCRQYFWSLSMIPSCNPRRNLKNTYFLQSCICGGFFNIPLKWQPWFKFCELRSGEEGSGF